MGSSSLWGEKIKVTAERELVQAHSPAESSAEGGSTVKGFD